MKNLKDILENKLSNNKITERLHINKDSKTNNISFDKFKDFVFRLIKLYKGTDTWIALCDQYGDRFVFDENKDDLDCLYLCVDEEEYLNSDTNLDPIKDITLNGKYIEFNNYRFVTYPYKWSKQPGGEYLTIDMLPTLTIYNEGHQYNLIDIIDYTDEELKKILK